jgi:hypothetical protein
MNIELFIMLGDKKIAAIQPENTSISTDGVQRYSIEIPKKAKKKNIDLHLVNKGDEPVYILPANDEYRLLRVSHQLSIELKTLSGSIAIGVHKGLEYCAGILLGDEIGTLELIIEQERFK